MIIKKTLCYEFNLTLAFLRLILRLKTDKSENEGGKSLF